MKKTEDKKTVKKVEVKKEAPKKEVGLSLTVFDLEGKKKKTVTLPKEIFSQNADDKLISLYVRVYLANQRQGTASAKTRAEIAGSTKKIYRQKGTGRARHGARSAPIFVGGGVVAGPRPRDYSLKLNKKQRKKAFFYALSQAQKDGEILGLDMNSLKAEPKTKKVNDFLKKVGLDNKKLILVFPKLEKNNLVLASRNIDGVSLRDAKSLNTYDVLNSQNIVFLEDSIKVMTDHFLKS